jgi:hypothetical protein
LLASVVGAPIALFALASLAQGSLRSHLGDVLLRPRRRSLYRGLDLLLPSPHSVALALAVREPLELLDLPLLLLDFDPERDLVLGALAQLLERGRLGELGGRQRLGQHGRGDLLPLGPRGEAPDALLEAPQRLPVHVELLPDVRRLRLVARGGADQPLALVLEPELLLRADPELLH